MLEDEHHVLFSCPSYNNMREDFEQDIGRDTPAAITAAPTEKTKMRVVLGSRHPQDWRALGKLLAMMRQFRRKSKANHNKLQELTQKIGYNIRV